MPMTTETVIALVCPDCGRPYPPHEGMRPEIQGCGRLAVPVPHVGLCVATDDRGGFAVRRSTRPIQTSLSLPQVGSFHG
ncbi:hypothetical protein HCU64_00100 [Methylobacterium sp. C25]|uniref:hypothetical protein n=1 Tax=Methylobacterium sp. C25 TaxID=2721622 RepID=UPI001F321991|nr:hypothetical protein [Methylobacterium sp. C25]MCE4222140.1 hypothetical protein [Methylobacterium sp. C25]